MKSSLQKSVLLLLFPSLLALSGCTGVDTTGSGSSASTSNNAATAALLVASGFATVKPTKPRGKELYAEAPAYSLLRGSVKGEVFYAYKDEAKGVAYVGGETQYQTFRQKAKEADARAAQLSTQNAQDWNTYIRGNTVKVRVVRDTMSRPATGY